MKIFKQRHTVSTKDAVVCAMKSESPLEKIIYLARAKREQRVDAFLTTASSEAKQEFLQDFRGIDRAISFHMSVSERLLLFIDNNVIQDISSSDDMQQPRRITRFHALLAFLALAEDYYCLDIFACISPAVLYEASHRGKMSPQEVAKM